MFWWLALAHALPVALPPGEDLAPWRGPAALAGVELESASTGARGWIAGQGRWEVRVVDVEGHEHRFMVDAPADEAAREDLLATICSLAEPVPTTRLPSPSLTPLAVPRQVAATTTGSDEARVGATRTPPAVPRRPAQAGSATSPSTPEAPEPSTAETPAEPSTAAPALSSATSTPPADVQETPDTSALPDPVIVPLDEPPPPPPERWRLRLSAAAGLQLRPKVTPGFSVAVGAGLERRRLGFTWDASFVPTQRTAELGPLRWWTEVGSTVGIARVGPGLGGGVSVGGLARHFAEIRGPVGWTWTPLLAAQVRYTVRWKRWAFGPVVWGQAEAGRVELMVDGKSVGRLSRFAGGLRLQIDRIAIGR